MEVRRISTLSGMMFRREEHFLTERAIRWKLTFDSELNRERMRTALESALAECPYMTLSMKPGKDRMWAVPNPAPVRLMSELPARLGESATDGHVMAVALQGKSLELSLYHGLTDGAGAEWFLEALLRAYFAEGANQRETKRRFTAVDLLETDYRLPEDCTPEIGMPEEWFEFPETEKSVHSVRYQMAFSRKELKALCTEMGCSVTAVMTSLVFAAIRRVHPENRKPLCVRSPVNSRSILGEPDTFLNASFPQVVISVDGFSPDRRGSTDPADLSGLTRRVSEQIRAQTARDHVACWNAEMGALLRKTPTPRTGEMMRAFRAPILFSRVGLDLPERVAGRVVHSAFSAYGAVPFSAYMTTVGDRCFLTVVQRFEDPAYMDALAEIMAEQGINIQYEEEKHGG